MRFAPPKHKKRTIQEKGQWKSVDLDPELLSEEGLLEGVVCFEKLTNYCLVDFKKLGVNAKNETQSGKKKGKKRKSSENEVVEKGDVDSKESEKISTPAKKKKKKNISKTDSTQDETIAVEVMQKDAGEEEAMNTNQEDTSKVVPATTTTKLKSKTQLKKKKQGQKEKDRGDDTNTTQNKETRPKKQQKNWTNAVLSGSEVKNADMRAWKGLFVPPVVLKALGSLGFTSPTPIQALVLPPAIRDRMDILGAAETGKSLNIFPTPPIAYPCCRLTQIFCHFRKW